MTNPPPLPPPIPPRARRAGFPWVGAGLVVALLLGAIVGLLIWKGRPFLSSAGQRLENWTVDERLSREVAALNRQTPKMVDKITRLDRVEYVGQREIEYEYTLLTYKVDQLDVDLFLKRLRKNLLENYRSDRELAYFRRHSVVLRHRYKDNEGQPIGELEMNLGKLDD